VKPLVNQNHVLFFKVKWKRKLFNSIKTMHEHVFLQNILVGEKVQYVIEMNIGKSKQKSFSLRVCLHNTKCEDSLYLCNTCNFQRITTVC